MRLYIFLTVIVIAFSGCNECIDCSGVAGKPTNKLCKSSYNDGGSGISWDTYKAALKASGCK